MLGWRGERQWRQAGKIVRRMLSFGLLLDVDAWEIVCALDNVSFLSSFVRSADVIVLVRATNKFPKPHFLKHRQRPHLTNTPFAISIISFHNQHQHFLDSTCSSPSSPSRRSSENFPSSIASSFALINDCLIRFQARFLEPHNGIPNLRWRKKSSRRAAFQFPRLSANIYAVLKIKSSLDCAPPKKELSDATGASSTASGWK